MTNVWVCSDCKSVNPLRSDRCYKCRSPRPPAGEELAAAAALALEPEPEQPRVTRPLDPERVAALGILGPAPKSERTKPEVSRSAQAVINPAVRVSTAPAAVVGIAVMIVVLGVRLVLTRFSLASLEATLNGGGVPEEESLFIGTLGLIYPLLGVLSIAALGFWANRVMTNVPLLGGGWPRFTPAQAFLEHVIPGWNVLRTPGVYRDIQTRLSENGTASDSLLVGWVLANIAAVVIVRPIGSTLSAFASSADDLIAFSSAVTYLSIALQGVAILLIALLVAEIESQQSARAKALLAPSREQKPVLNEAIAAVHAAVASRRFTAVVGSGRARPGDRPIGPAEDKAKPRGDRG